MNWFYSLIATTLAMAIIVGTAHAQKDPKPPKLALDELIAKHLVSLGTPEAIAAAKSRVMVGTLTLSKTVGPKDKAGVSKLSGTAQYASLDNRMLFAFVFETAVLPREIFAFDGEKVTFSFPGDIRTELMGIPKNHTWIIKEGLLGGTLSSGWALLKTSQNKSQLEYGGDEKVEGRECYKIKYSPKTGDATSRATIFLDAATFRHIRTEYVYQDGGLMKVPALGTLSLHLVSNWVEDFSDFRQEGSLILPHTHTLAVTIGSAPRAESTKWETKFSLYYFDQQLDSSAFRVF